MARCPNSLPMQRFHCGCCGANFQSVRATSQSRNCPKCRAPLHSTSSESDDARSVARAWRFFASVVMVITIFTAVAIHGLWPSAPESTSQELVNGVPRLPIAGPEMKPEEKPIELKHNPRTHEQSVVARLQQLVRPLDGDDIIFVMLSGHGFDLAADDGGAVREDAVFCPHDADPDRRKTLNRRHSYSFDCFVFQVWSQFSGNRFSDEF